MNLGTGVPAVPTGIVYITGTTASVEFSRHCEFDSARGGRDGRRRVRVAAEHRDRHVAVFDLSRRHQQRHWIFGLVPIRRATPMWPARPASTDFPITQGACCETRANSQRRRVRFQDQPPRELGWRIWSIPPISADKLRTTSSNPGLWPGIAVSGTNAYITGQMTSPDMPVSAGRVSDGARSMRAPRTRMWPICL